MGIEVYFSLLSSFRASLDSAFAQAEFFLETLQCSPLYNRISIWRLSNGILEDIQRLLMYVSSDPNCGALCCLSIPWCLWTEVACYGAKAQFSLLHSIHYLSCRIFSSFKHSLNPAYRNTVVALNSLRRDSTKSYLFCHSLLLLDSCSILAGLEKMSASIRPLGRDLLTFAISYSSILMNL